MDNHDIRRIALQGISYELSDRDMFESGGSYYQEHEWRDYAKREVVLPSLENDAVALGGYRVHIQGDVGENAIILASYGGATVEIDGNVHDSARIYAGGGGATVLIHGNVASRVRLYAQGGGAEIIVRGTCHPSVEFSVRGGGARVIKGYW